MPIAEAAGTLSLLKNAYDLTKGMVEINAAVKADGRVFELQRLILDAQSAEGDRIEEIRKLRSRIDELEAWEEDAKRYELHTLDRGGLTYRLKASAANGEPEHQLCANCFQVGRKSILQKHQIPEGRSEVLMCHPCGQQLVVRGVVDTRAGPKNGRAGSFSR